jgi:hypothetical protein
MSADLDRLYNLLPAVYRSRDAEQGEPLRGLLQVISEQVNLVEDDIAQLYENLFIETCQDWVVPYIGDLVGYQVVHDAGEPGDVTTSEGSSRNKILIPRREVANTIRYRRRKGALAVLELLANAAAGWPARAVEYYQLLVLAQAINFLHLQRGRSVDLRDGDALDRLDGPFDEVAHSVDVRRPDSHRTSGRYNITSVGLFVWRLRTYKVTRTEAYCLEQINSQSYSFSILGNDTPLFTPAAPQAEPPRSPGEMELPAPIRRWPFEQRTTVGSAVVRQASPLYYGDGRPVTIWAENWPVAGAPQPIPASSVIPADLSGWVYRAPRDHVVVDPVLGRIVFPARQLPKDKVFVSYYYGFSSEIGGGEYERLLSQPADYKIYYVGEGETYTRISDAVDQWKTDKPFNAVIEITDSGVYVEQLDISLLENHSLQLRAANKKRPVLRVLDWRTSAPDSLRVAGEAGSWFTLDGLLVTGRGLQVDGALAGMIIRHSTIVPGWGLHCDCEPWRPTEPSVVLNEAPRCLRVEHSILGSIQVNREEVREDPGKIHISDSILDATSPQEEALCAPEETIANVILCITRSTVIGRMCLHQLELGENSIFYGIVTVARRQTGCVRFSYVTPGSRTPRRYSCQPDLAQASVPAEFRAQEAERVRPRFNTLRYGQPAYCQLADDCSVEIKRGADDESEMGAFHDLFQPQREANLRIRLEEYTSAGLNQGIFFAT